MGQPAKYQSADKKVVKHTREFDNERTRLGGLEEIFAYAEAASKLDIPFTITTIHTQGNRKGGDYPYDIYGYRITFEGCTEIGEFD